MEEFFTHFLLIYCVDLCILVLIFVMQMMNVILSILNLLNLNTKIEVAIKNAKRKQKANKHFENKHKNLWNVWESSEIKKQKQQFHLFVYVRMAEVGNLCYVAACNSQEIYGIKRKNGYEYDITSFLCTTAMWFHTADEYLIWKYCI